MTIDNNSKEELWKIVASPGTGYFLEHDNWTTGALEGSQGKLYFYVKCPYCEYPTFSFEVCCCCSRQIPRYYLDMRNFLNNLMKL